MKNKKLLLAAAALLAIAVVLAGIYFLFMPETQPGDKTIIVTVVFSTGKQKSFIYHTQEEYLGPVLVKERLVEGTSGEYGLMIHKVHGEAASWEENQSWWCIYVGDEPATLGADFIPIHDGDTFKLVYTIG